MPRSSNRDFSSRYGPWAADVVRQLDSVAWNLLDTLSPDRISAFAGAVEIVEAGAAPEPTESATTMAQTPSANLSATAEG